MKLQSMVTEGTATYPECVRWIEVTDLSTNYTAVDVVAQRKVSNDCRQLMYAAYSCKTSADNVRYTLCDSQNFLQCQCTSKYNTNILDQDMTEKN